MNPVRSGARRAREVAREVARDRLGGERVARARLARALLKQHRYILYFGHMRSYSTLLGHLMAGHPQISGYVEQHQHYKTFADLSELTVGVWKVSGHALQGDYLFDKILHDNHVITDEVLHRPDVLPIYGVREPVASVRSIVAMGRRAKRPSWNHVDGAARHLTNRYAVVRELAGRRPDAAALFTDSLVTAPEQTLADLSAYLGLDSAIRPEYGTQPKTGVGGWGDPMGPIKAGRIVADRPTHDIEVPEELAARLVEDYMRTAEVLTRCATVVGRPVETSPVEPA